MRANHSFLLIAVLVMILLTMSCAGNTGNQNPVNPENSAIMQAATPADSEAGHQLWGWYKVYADPANNKYEITPVRIASSHWNVIKFLEQSPCANCFKITGSVAGPDNTRNIDITIKHPFPIQNFTGFDVRGIVMFDGSHPFPISGLNVSNKTLGDGELVNADGFTTLYNIDTQGSGPGGFEGYFKGKMATPKKPNALLNGFPANTRNAFYAGDHVTATYQIDMPDGGMIFAYAIDASWAPATTKPVTNPMTDFGPEANCPEAWKIDVAEAPVGDGLTECGGSTLLTLNVYDHQGKDDVHPITLECPELFDGSVEATWKSDSTGFTTYEATISNAKNAYPGKYQCLISKEASENSAAKPWLNLTAFQIHQLEVVNATDNAPTASAQASKTLANQGELVDFDASASTDNDCNGQSIVKYEWDWNGDGSFVEGPAQTSHSWDAIGDYNVQLRVTDDESNTAMLATPLTISVQEYVNSAPEITAVTHSRTTSHKNDVKEKVTLGVEFTDLDDTSAHIYLWTCPVGVFDDPGSATPVWSPPNVSTKCEITVRVTDAGDLFDEGTCSQWVTKWPTLTNASAPGNTIISQNLAEAFGGSLNPSTLKWPTALPNGNVVYMNFYATWCGPCMAEMPELSAIYQEYKDNPEYVHLLIDDGEAAATVENWLNSNDYEASHWLLDTTGSYYSKSIGWTTNPGYIPTHLIFDRDGHCRGQIVGGISGASTLTQYFDELL
jgi:thiol-disulfide isomerase/thioredoxin